MKSKWYKGTEPELAHLHRIYAVICQCRNDEFHRFYLTAEEATAAAQREWLSLTESERSSQHIYSVLISLDDLDFGGMDWDILDEGRVDWDCWIGFSSYEGAFDSNALTDIMSRIEEDEDEENPFTDYSIAEGGERFRVRYARHRSFRCSPDRAEIAIMLRDLIEYARDHSSEYVGKPEPVPYGDDGDDICYIDGAHTVLC